MKAIRRNRNLFLLVQGQFVTNAGNQIFNIAMLLWIKELTGSATIMGLAMLLTSLPEALLAPFGGKLADRFGRLRTIILSDVFSAGAVGIVLLTVWFSTDPGMAILALCVCNVLLGCSAACFGPAISALVPSLVGEQNLEKGNAAHQFGRVSGQMLGQGLGGLLFAVVGVGGTFLINAFSFILSAFSETRIKVPRNADRPIPVQQDEPLIKQTIVMMGQVWRDRKTRALLVYIAVFHLCLSCLPILLPFYAEHILAIKDVWFGLLVAVYTLGIMLGFIVATMIKPKSRFQLISIASTGVGTMFFGLVLSSSVALSVVFLSGIGIGIGIVIINLTTELQLSSPEVDRAGIMGVAQAIGGSSLPIGMALTGLVLDGLQSQGMSIEVAMRGILVISATIATIAAVNAFLKDFRTR